jgi:hypothetical protein
MAEVVDVVARHAALEWTCGASERQDVVWRHRPDDLAAFSRGDGPGETVRSAADHRAPGSRLTARLEQAGVSDGLTIASRKPEWLRPKVEHGPEVLALKRTVRDLGLVTVCEEAGCPNLSECCADGTATFMVLGERCTRACGFCLVDTRKPMPPQADEPTRHCAGDAGDGATSTSGRIVVDDRAKGPAYGVMSEDQKRFLVRVARATGLVLDPVYTGKALFGVAQAVERGEIRPGSRVLFIHTGGLPGLLAQGEELRDALG